MIGEYIRAARERKKVSQYAVAYAIGMSQAAYSKIERGETEVKVSHIYSIAAFLKISIYELLPEAMASNAFNGDDYLFKPIIIRIKGIWYRWKVNRRLTYLKKHEF